MPFHVNSNRYVNSTFDDPAFVTYMIMDGIHENNSVNTLQWSFLPFFYDGQDLICDPADCAVRDLDIIQLPHMTFDIAGCHPFGIHGNDLFFHVLSDRILIFFYDLRHKLAFSVPRNINLHVPITSMHGFLRMPISGIISVFVTIIVLGIAQFLIHFLIQSTFQDN